MRSNSVPLAGRREAVDLRRGLLVDFGSVDLAPVRDLVFMFPFIRHGPVSAYRALSISVGTPSP
jgi:hypothetical protein